MNRVNLPENLLPVANYLMIGNAERVVSVKVFDDASKCTITLW